MHFGGPPDIVCAQANGFAIAGSLRAIRRGVLRKLPKLQGMGITLLQRERTEALDLSVKESERPSQMMITLLPYSRLDSIRRLRSFFTK